MTTISVIKADIGGLVGHTGVDPDILSFFEEGLKEESIFDDFFVGWAGDDIALILSHNKGENHPEVHRIAWELFKEAAELAKDKKLYGAGQDILKDSFSGNVKGSGLGVAEMEFEERPSEPIVVFLMDKTEPSAFNLPLYKMFADPFNTPGLIIDKGMSKGFRFLIYDLVNNKQAHFETPEESYALLGYIGDRHYAIKKVFARSEKFPEKEPVASVSTEKLSLIAGRYIGKDDPVAIVRAQSGLPAVGEILEAFSHPWLVAGWMRGSHIGPLMPVPMEKANPSRFDGPPRVVALGFQVNDGKLEGPVDLFDDVAFDRVREKANEVADYIRLHGPFEPHRLPAQDLEYTTLPDLQERYKERWQPIE
ncbi:MAG: fructose 1,6-bisphosphatase [Candidatus Micrarchaeota archaeon]|nr:fructose 1,6-bisphosphatase [Candidatus Micrarchaeota archaeon]